MVKAYQIRGRKGGTIGKWDITNGYIILETDKDIAEFKNEFPKTIAKGYAVEVKNFNPKNRVKLLTPEPLSEATIDKMFSEPELLEIRNVFSNEDFNIIRENVMEILKYKGGKPKVEKETPKGKPEKDSKSK
jgi:hypothetical protein